MRLCAVKFSFSIHCVILIMMPPFHITFTIISALSTLLVENHFRVLIDLNLFRCIFKNISIIYPFYVNSCIMINIVDIYIYLQSWL